MDPAVSRRSLFRAVLPQTSPAARAAHVGPACIEPAGVSCRRCAEVCGADAISFPALGRGRSAPIVARDRCTGCGECQPVCPVSAIDLRDVETAALVRGLARLGARDR